MNLDALPHEFATSERITIDYLKRANSLKQVFPRHFREPSIRDFNIDRQKIADRLLTYNKRLNAPKQVIRNAESLSQAGTYAIITGQQPGVFSGPLYTVYKALSAIVLCARLSTERHRFVPIFWNASEDHDLSEINHVAIFKENEPLEIRYRSKLKNVAFSHVSLDKTELKKMLATIDDVSPNSEFKALLLKEINGIIQGASNVGDFFSRFMIFLFGEQGLVMVEPQCLRDLMAPVFDTLIRSPTECTRILNEAGSRLDELGYSPKIHKKSNICNFFVLNDEGKRQQVTYNGKFKVADETFSQRELLRLLTDDPARFSANAVTRPITQDFLFPTFAYIAGPHELAYLAQLKEVYDFFSFEMPVIFPRFGATIVEKKVSKVLRKYSVEIPDFGNPDRLLKNLAKEKIDDALNTFRSEILRGINELTQQAKSLDETLVGPCSLARGRLLKTIEVLEDKLTTRLKAHEVIAEQQIMKAYRNLFPYGDLQERRINVLEYLIKYGKEFLSSVHQNFFEADYGEHKVITC